MKQACAPLGWFGILRLGLVQAALGAVVVLVTSTLNRVMVVEYRLPAMLPGVLVALHYAVQMIRPRFGYGSDRGGRRTSWILGGMAVLAVGGVSCALATVSLAAHPWSALLLAIAAYSLVGLGVGAAGTSLLVLLATQVSETRRAAAATIMWVLMIVGFAITSTTVGHFLDPFSPHRLLLVVSVASLAAFFVALAAVWGVESDAAHLPVAHLPVAHLPGANLPGVDPQLRRVRMRGPAQGSSAAHGFKTVLREVWAEPEARGFTLFVFISMLAYSAQELLMEPFAGLVFGYSLGASAALSGLQHSGVFLGMIGVGVACSGRRRFGSLRSWTLGGCFASAAALLSLVFANWVGPSWPLRASVFALGLSNGVFAVAAIGSMMALAHKSGSGNPGVRMGLWGAAQALAFALGGFLSTTLVDSARFVFGSPAVAFGIVFFAEAVLFFVAARLAAHGGRADLESAINLSEGAINA